MHRLIKVIAAGEEFTGEFACDLAALGDGAVHALSCAGDHTTIRFLHAALRDQETVRFHFLGLENVSTTRQFVAERTYDVRITHLGYDCWHLLAVDDSGQLLLHDDEETLWSILRSDRFTTPLLRSWMPDVQKALRDAELLAPLESHGCNASLLVTGNESLDQVVSEGLRQGVLQIQTTH